MSEKLDQINKQIESVESRQEKLSTEIRDLSILLSQKRTEQIDAIVAESDAKKLANQVVTLQTQLLGAQAAHKKLDATLLNLREQKAAELREIGYSQAEIAKIEANAMAGVIYSLLVELVGRILDLRAKVREFNKALRAHDPKSEYKSMGMRSLCTSLEDAIDKALSDKFPIAIFGDGKFPNPEALKRSLRKGSMR